MLYIDIETRSRTDLKKLGVYRYSEDIDFSIMMAGWSVDGEPAQCALGHDDILAIPGLLDPEVTKVAHNAQFERVCLGVLDESLLEPNQWLDTASLAAEYGYPVSLEAAALALGAAPKDSAGSRLVRLFCVPNKDGSWNTAETHPMEWLDFITYCEQDVDTMVDIHRRLGDWPTEMERRVWVADQHVNDRGMKIDLVLCQLAASEVDRNKVRGKERFTELTGVDNPGSVQQVMVWANDPEGPNLGLKNLRAETVQGVLDDPATDPELVELLELRQELALAAGGKFTAALDVVSPDDRIRGGFRFFGAHTGRWTGQRVQPQNLPRATVEFPEAHITALKNGHGAEPDVLKALVRSMFLGPLTVVDYASIEARVLAWMADEEWALQAFRDGRDIYVETAARMGKDATRAHGKVAVLALGYNGGTNSLIAMGGGDLVSSVVDSKIQKWQASGSFGDARKKKLELTNEELFRVVQDWRAANPRIVRLWGIMADAVDSGGRVGAHIKITRRGDSMKMHLPSGRAICYHGVKWEKYVVIDPETGKKVFKEGWRYNDPKKGGQRIGTYGGRLVENATQAIARDVLAEALVRLDEAGYDVVGHVHDEIITESTELEAITKLMVETPRWGRGLPLDAEGFVCDRYRKG